MVPAYNCAFLGAAQPWQRAYLSFQGCEHFSALDAGLCIICVVQPQLATLSYPQNLAKTGSSQYRIAAAVACLAAAHPLHVDTYALSVGQSDTLCAIIEVIAVMLRTCSLGRDLTEGVDAPWTWAGGVLGPSIGFTALCVLACSAKEIGAMLIHVLCCIDAVVMVLPHMLQTGGALRTVVNSKYCVRSAVQVCMWAAIMYVRLRVLQPGAPSMPRSSNLVAHNSDWFVHTLTLWWAAAWHFTSAPTSIIFD